MLGREEGEGKSTNQKAGGIKELRKPYCNDKRHQGNTGGQRKGGPRQPT